MKAKYAGICWYIATLDGQPTSKRLASEVSASHRTIQRWLSEMRESGLVERKFDGDGRAIFSLSSTVRGDACYVTDDACYVTDDACGGDADDVSSHVRAHPSDNQRLSSVSNNKNNNNNSARDSGGGTDSNIDGYDPVEAAENEKKIEGQAYPNTNWSDLNDAQKVEEHLVTCGFNQNTPSNAMKILRAGMSERKIDDDDLLGFAITHINTIAGKVDSNEWSRSQAYRCLGNRIGVEQYLSTKSNAKRNQGESGDSKYDFPELEKAMEESRNEDYEIDDDEIPF